MNAATLYIHSSGPTHSSSYSTGNIDEAISILHCEGLGIFAAENLVQTAIFHGAREDGDVATTVSTFIACKKRTIEAYAVGKWPEHIATSQERADETYTDLMQRLQCKTADIDRAKTAPVSVRKALAFWWSSPANKAEAQAIAKALLLWVGLIVGINGLGWFLKAVSQ